MKKYFFPIVTKKKFRHENRLEGEGAILGMFKAKWTYSDCQKYAYVMRERLSDRLVEKLPRDTAYLSRELSK